MQNVIVWTDDELKTIVKQLDNNRFRLLVLMAIHTGCRISELLGLQYSDLHDQKVYITKQLSNVAIISDDGTKRHELSIKEPKTTTSVRNIPLSQYLIKVFHHIGIHSALIYAKKVCPYRQHISSWDILVLMLPHSSM